MINSQRVSVQSLLAHTLHHTTTPESGALLQSVGTTEPTRESPLVQDDIYCALVTG